ncbi:MAG TPA: hypothetical protein DC057_00085 [Spirochaetia bacterium]|nr:hypothetical protein [Spirochaetia bacterium]
MKTKMYRIKRTDHIETLIEIDNVEHETYKNGFLFIYQAENNLVSVINLNNMIALKIEER